MENLERILAEHPFLAGMEPSHLEILVGCASNVRFEIGQLIFRQGEDADVCYLLRRGRVSVEVFSPNRGPVVIQTVGEGDVLGWSWLTPPYYWHFDARALDPTLAIALDGKCLRRKCDEDHGLGYVLLKRVATIIEQRLQATRLQLLDVYGNHS
ncbi:MAG: cyclic nucleotide-binding domain-containing protein [Acidobacteria bacterium]|nr:cyclic nucleotide-binding domain-containing protein [Acidobacteriota bacterium]MBI3655198.1 cyclic nucleotide-binding domain-containing protein [Acidobacteriota bacterium]